MTLPSNLLPVSTLINVRNGQWQLERFVQADLVCHEDKGLVDEANVVAGQLREELRRAIALWHAE